MPSRRRKASTPRRHKPQSPLDRAKAHELDWESVAGLFDAARTLENPHFVYVIGEPDNGPVKIGHSTDPIMRLRHFQTGNPRRLRLEQLVLGDKWTEALLHEAWEPYLLDTGNRKSRKLDTEWFRAEIRAKLFPIFRAAAESQCNLLSRTSGEIRIVSLERMVRRAHAEHDFTFHKREQIRNLAFTARP